MPSVQRNQPCPCGSAKKYRKCCGAGRGAHNPVVGIPRERTPFTGVPGSPIELSLPAALHGQNQYIVFEPLPGPVAVGGGEPGTYKVVFTLGRPGFPQRSEGKFTCEQNLEGDSHLYVRLKPETVEIMFSLQTPEGAFDFHGVPNRFGHLGKLWTEHAVAKDYYDAERKAWTALSPTLSWLSVHLDIPLFVEQVDIIDRHTGGQMIKVLLAYRTIGLSVAPVHAGTPEFQYYASLYRDALCTNSALYQFLCLYKIVDAVAARRSRASRVEGSTDRPKPSDQLEIVPANESSFKPWMNAIFPTAVRLAWSLMHFDSICRPEARGKEFSALSDAYLRPIRNRIAHSLIGSGELGYSIDNASDLQRVFHWLPLLKCMVRRLLKNEFPNEFMPGWRDDGSFDMATEEKQKAEWSSLFRKA